MKKRGYLLSLIFACGLILSSVLVTNFAGNITARAASVDFAKGDGTIESPFIVSTVEEFDRIRYHRDAYFEQEGNLDFSAKENFAPIGSASFPFSGFYNGKKYSIVNLNINYPELSNVGLFSFLFNGEIKDVKIHKATIVGEYNVGSVVGVNRGTLKGIISSANISGKNNVGGIAGTNSNKGIIEECGNLGAITSAKDIVSGMYAGGITGSNFFLIKNSYNRGDVNASQTLDSSGSISIYSGGIAGLNNGEKTDAKIEQVYNIGDVNGAAKGQIVGDNLKGKIVNGKWLTQDNKNNCFAFNSDVANDINNIYITSEDFGVKNSFWDWNEFSTKWMHLGDDPFPILEREYVKIEKISFDGGENVKLMPGQSYEIKPIITPIHSTIRTAKIGVTANEGDLSSFDKISNTITIGEQAKIGAKILINAQVEELNSSLIETNLIIEIIKIPVERVEITNETGVNTISAAKTLQFGAKVFPSNASNKKVGYSVNSSYAAISDSGQLTIKDETPVGTKILVMATSKDNANAYSTMEVTTVKVTVDKVELTVSGSFKVTQYLELSGRVLPEKATNKNIVYTIVSDTDNGAKIENNILTAKKLGSVTIVGEVDGVKSEQVTIQVVKEPVQKLEFLNTNRIKCGEQLLLETRVSPANATNTQVDYVIIENAANATLDDGIVTAKIDGYVVVQAIADGITATLKIVVEKIAVEKVNILFGDCFKHTQSLGLDIEVLPKNATYIIPNYSILSDTANSKIEKGKLCAEKPGTVELQIEVDGIIVVKKIDVLKEAVASISLTAKSVQHDGGEAWQFRADILPNNATNREYTYKLVSGNASLSQDGLLVININNAIGSLIEVSVIADGLESAIYKIYSGKVEVKEVKLSANETSTKVGEPIDLTVKTVPALVSNPSVTYRVEGSGYVEDGQFIATDTAAAGSTIKVFACVDGVTSAPIEIKIKNTPVERIQVNSASSFKVTENLKLSATAFPVTATDRNIKFSIVSGLQIGAKIEDGYLYATNIGTIVIRATAGGKTYDFGVKVLKEPVTGIILTSAKQIKVMQELTLKVNIQPINATNKKVSYSIVGDNFIDATIDNNVFISYKVGKVTIRISVDDIYRDYEIEVLKEPVTSIAFNSQNSFKHTERLKLSSTVLPSNATFKEVTYEVLANNVNARIVDGYLYADKPGEIRLKLSADDYSTEITVNVIKEAVTNIEFAQNTEKKIVLNKEYRIGGTQLNTNVAPNNATYSKVIYSIDEKNTSDNLTVLIDGNELKITLNKLVLNGKFAADMQGKVTIIATADGVSKSYTFDVYKNKVSENDIGITVQGQISPSEWNSVDHRTFKTSEKLRINAVILNELVTYKETKIEVLANLVGAKFESGSSNILIANTPEKFSVRVTSLCDGTYKDFEFTVLEEDVAKVYLGTELTSSDNKNICVESDDKIVPTANYQYSDIGNFKNYALFELQQGGQIALHPFAHATNTQKFATYGDMSNLKLCYSLKKNELGIEFARNKDNKYEEGNEYFDYNGSTLTIKSNAPVTKSVYLYATDKTGKVVSERTEIIIQSKYINDIKNATISSDGLINMTDLTIQETVESVRVKIENTSKGISFSKTFITKSNRMMLQLYKSSTSGSFNIEYEIFFNENGNKYSYILPKVNEFGGIYANSVGNQYINSTYNSIVLLDYSYEVNIANAIKSNVKALYVYSSSYQARTTYFDISNSTTEIDMYLHGFSFNAPTNQRGINATGSGKLKLTTIGSVSISGGFGSSGGNGQGYGRSDYATGKNTAKSGENGADGQDGQHGICANNLEIENRNTFYVYGGSGGSGGRGGDGQGSDCDGNATAGSGGRGGDGGNGGDAIYVGIKLTLTSANLRLYGGDAGFGGYGGDGGNSTTWNNRDHAGDGGRGGNGGFGGVGLYVSQICVTISDSYIYILSGDGGRGGNGGEGGFADVCGFDKPNKGSGGDGGNGGNSGHGVESYNNASLFANQSINLGYVGSYGNKGAYGSGSGVSKLNGHDGKDGSKGTKIL